MKLSLIPSAHRSFVQQGLLDEVRLLQRAALSDSPQTAASDIDTTAGIFQAIGKYSYLCALIFP